MNIAIVAEEMFKFRPFAAILIPALYVVPILRLAGFPLEYGGRHFMRVNRIFGIWEHIVWPIRDSLVAIYVAGIFVWHVLIFAEAHESKDLIIAFSALFLLASGLVSKIWKRDAHLKLMEFAIKSPMVHPKEFFDHMLCASGAVRHKFPSEPFLTLDPTKIDFRVSGGGRIGLISKVAGLWGTIWMAGLMISAKNLRGAEFARRVASSFALIWGERILELCRAALSIEGLERIPSSKGAQIFLFTHMSFIDFALVAILLAAKPREGGREPDYMPIFLLAKDHFRDNIFLYRILGIGRVAEMFDMIFVDRKSQDKIAEARRISKEAVDRLNAGDVIAIFPQGTRAAPLLGPQGERRDGSYYTVGGRDRIKRDAEHLKKGAAHIALDAATEMKVTLVPVAISGTAIACPRRSMRIKSNALLRLKIGEPIGIGPAGEVGMADVENLHRRIDDSLRTETRIHAELERRFFEDIHWMFEPMEIEEISLAMKTWRGEDFLVHAILDAIYCCRPKDHRPLVHELAHHMLNFESREKLLEFKGRVADAVPM